MGTKITIILYFSLSLQIKMRKNEKNENTLISAVVGVFGASALWGIGELFEQKKRVERGWFPQNPKREKK